jgi:hypothetical protein
MHALDPHVAALLVTSTGVGFLMAMAGVHKSALEWRRRRRVCPSCGRRLNGTICGCPRG